MDSEEFDSIQLLSLSEVVENYYQMLRHAMENAAIASKNKNDFDGRLLDEDVKNVAGFSERNEVPLLSQSLAELMVCLERHNERKLPTVRDTSLYNNLLRLEKFVRSSSSWELYGEDCDGPLLDLSTFEINMIEQQMSLYVADILDENYSNTIFFPLDNFYSSDDIVKWRILEKIATIKLFAKPTIYKQKLKFHLRERLKKEIGAWLSTEVVKLKLVGVNTVLKDAEVMAKVLRELRSHTNNAIDVAASETLFNETGCSYFETLAETVDDKLFPLCKKIMEQMDVYQSRHRDFHVNMRDSCALSHSLYLQLKKLFTLLNDHGKTDLNLKLQEYTLIFSKFFLNLLLVVQQECHNRIKRAVQIEVKDNVHIEESILSSSVIVLNCICTVIDEWKHMEIEEEEQKIAFLVKITDITCDGAKIYAEFLEHRLGTMNLPLKDTQAMKKVCVLANSIEHVLQYLQDLPSQMQWSEVLDSLSEDPPGLRQQLHRILGLIHESMRSHLTEVVQRMLSDVVDGAYHSVDKAFKGWMNSQPTHQSFEKFLFHLSEVIENVEGSLKEDVFLKFLSHLWTFLIARVQKSFLEGQPPEYAKNIKDNILALEEFFQQGNMQHSDLHQPHLQQLLELLDLHSKSTEELQLDYYVQIAESITSPVEYLGHIAFQAGYKAAGGETVDLYINVQKGQRLPARKFEMSYLIVKVELCPSSLFPSQVPFKSSTVYEDLDSPVFNEFFQFSKLPSSILNVKGAVVQVLVLNQDYSYSAEAILLLNQVQNMSGVASLDFLPVYLMPLRKFDMSHITYQVLENRSRWDKNAKMFINKRGKLTKSQKKFLPCIPGKSVICTFSKSD